MTQALDEIKIGGMGASRKRVEDSRFIRGKGNYIDDILLPGMLHMEILRSPFAHARITLDRHQQGVGHPRGAPGAHRRDDGDPQPGLDAHAVLRHPGGAGHRQGPVPGPGGRLRHRRRPLHRQGRLRGDRRRLRAAAGRRQPEAAAAADAPIIRDDKENQDSNVIYNWEVGDAAGTDRAFEEADLVSRLQLHYPQVAPEPDRVLRLHRRLQPVDIEAHRLHDDPGAAHHPRPRSRWSPSCPST